MSGGPYGGKSSLATVRAHRLARAPPTHGKYLDLATDRSVPRSLASSVHARRRGRGRTRLRSGDGHLHRPGTSRARLSSPLGGGTRIVTLARESTTGRSPRRTTRRFEGFSIHASRREKFRGRTDERPADLPVPSRPSPPAVQKVSAAAILLRAGTSRAGGDASRVSPERGRESVTKDDEHFSPRRVTTSLRTFNRYVQPLVSTQTYARTEHETRTKHLSSPPSPPCT